MPAAVMPPLHAMSAMLAPPGFVSHYMPHAGGVDAAAAGADSSPCALC